MKMVTKRTTAEIEALKHNWTCDACWDIEATEGFEAHREELKAFRIEWEQKNEDEYNTRLKEQALKLGIPDRVDLVKYFEGLEHKIERLNERIGRLDGGIF